jgi:hypothetical protein
MSLLGWPRPFVRLPIRKEQPVNRTTNAMKCYQSCRHIPILVQIVQQRAFWACLTKQVTKRTSKKKKKKKIVQKKLTHNSSPVQTGSVAHPAWAPQALSPRVKQPRREANHSPPPSTEFKNKWSYTSAPPTCLHAVHRDFDFATWSQILICCVRFTDDSYARTRHIVTLCVNFPTCYL